MSNTGVVNIRGREYKTVALRVQEFREQHPDWLLNTEIVNMDDTVVVMRATISDREMVLATGHSEEYRTASQINKTSALENAETSAIGRALAALGYGGSEFASANEVANAIHQQENSQPQVSRKVLARFEQIVENEESVALAVFHNTRQALYVAAHGQYMDTVARGGKGKERERIDAMLADGQKILSRTLDGVLAALQEGDDARHLWADMSEAEAEWIMDQIPQELQALAREGRTAAKEAA